MHGSVAYMSRFFADLEIRRTLRYVQRPPPARRYIYHTDGSTVYIGMAMGGSAL